MASLLREVGHGLLLLSRVIRHGMSHLLRMRKHHVSASQDVSNLYRVFGQGVWLAAIWGDWTCSVPSIDDDQTIDDD